MFTDSERQIFQFFDGRRVRWADPIEVWDRLQAELAGALDDLLQKSAGEVTADPELPADAQQRIRDAVTADANRQLRAAVRVAFEMAPWDPGAGKAEEAGATSQDCDNALDGYLDFLDAQKKSSDPSPTSSDGSAAA